MTDETTTQPAPPTPVIPDLGDLLGGRRGVIDASIPGVVLVFVDAFVDLWPAIIAAVAAAAVLAGVRALRREPLKQVGMGLLGLALAAGLAAWTGTAKNFFLPGILINAGYAVGVTISILVGHPALAYVAAMLDRRYSHWKTHPPLRRAATLATWVWVAVFAIRSSVMGFLYFGDHDGWLASMKLALGLPLWAVAVASTLFLLEGHAQDDEEIAQDDVAEPAPS